METMISFGQLASIFKDYGPFGIIVVIWFFDIRQMRSLAKENSEMADKHRSEVMAILAEHKGYMAEMRRMYENNVILVSQYEAMAKDMKDIIIMNTQELTHLQADIEQNQFCPAMQINKKQIKVMK